MTKKKVAKKAASKRVTKKKVAKRGGGGAFMRPVTPDKALQAVVGVEPRPRTEIVKRLWEYIREHSLQDSENRRMVNADSKLRTVFNGKRQVTMFEMTKLVSQHLKAT